MLTRSIFLVSLLSIQNVFGQKYDYWNMGLLSNPLYPYCSDVWGYTDEKGHEFAVFGVLDGTVILDVSTNPSIPVETGYIIGDVSGWRDLKTYGHYLYVVSEGGGGMDIIDLADPWNPQLVGKFRGFLSAHNLFISDGYAYIVGSNKGVGGIRILDLSDPVNPVEVGSWETTYIHDIYVKNDTAYACAIVEGDLHILDVSDKADIRTMTVLDYDSYGCHAVWTTEDSKFIITADEKEGGHVKIWNAQDFDNISLASEYQVGHNKSVHNVFVKGDKLFVSYYVYGTRVVDISDPYNPVEVAYFDLHPGEAGLYSGNWGTYPFTHSGLVYSTSASGYGFFILKYPLYVEFSHEPLGDIEDTEGPYPVSVIMNPTEDNKLIPETAMCISGLNLNFTDTTYLTMGTDPGEFTGFIPGYGIAGDLTYYFAVQDTAGRWSTEPYGAPESYYAFHVGPDPEPPVIHSVSEIEDQFGRSGRAEVSTVVTDNIAVGEVTLRYTFSSDTPDTTYSVPMIFDGVQWRGEIRWENVPWHTIIAYQVIAIDSTSQLNEAASELISFEILNWTMVGSWETENLSFWDTGQGWGIVGLGSVGRVINDSPGTVYKNNANNILTNTNPLDISPYNSAYLSFWHFSLLEPDKDFGYVELSTDGENWSVVSSITGLATVRDELIDLGSYIDSGEVWLRFRMVSDGQNAYGGWYIDDIMFMVDTTVQTISVETPMKVPHEISLEQNFPNPFNPMTTIIYQLPYSADVRLTVYDLLGRNVATLVDGRVEPGIHRSVWDASTVANGIYFYRLSVNRDGILQKILTRKMTVIK